MQQRFQWLFLATPAHPSFLTTLDFGCRVEEVSLWPGWYSWGRLPTVGPAAFMVIEFPRLLTMAEGANAAAAVQASSLLEACKVYGYAIFGAVPALLFAYLVSCLPLTTWRESLPPRRGAVGYVLLVWVLFVGLALTSAFACRCWRFGCLEWRLCGRLVWKEDDL